MRFPGHPAAQNHRHIIPLPADLNSSHICTIYGELKQLPDTARLRVKSTEDGILLYASGKSAVLESNFNKSNLQEKRQALVDLIRGLTNDYAKTGSINRDQGLALERLRLALDRHGRIQDFTVGELKNLLKPLNNSVRTRKLLLVSKALREQSDEQHYRSFINMDKPTKNLLNIALFGHQSRSFSLARQRSILSSFLSLVETIFNKKASRESIVRLIRENKNKVALLEFSDAWLAAIKQPRSKANAFDKMPWKHAIGNLSKLIQCVLSRPANKSTSSDGLTKTSPVKSPVYLKKLQDAHALPADTRPQAQPSGAMSPSIFEAEAKE